MQMGIPGSLVRLGIIGLGGRGQGQVETLLQMQDIRITAVCDVYPDRVEKGAALVEQSGAPAPAREGDYRKVLAREDVDAVVIMTSWQTHIPIAIEAMKAGKAVGMEVGGANSVEECFDLVRVSQATGIGCMLLENCCYGKEELTLLNMIRQGVFGELVHCAGGYEHDLRDEIGLGDLRRHYRQDHFRSRNAELYPTHELGPIAKYLNLHHGNRMTSLVSMASKAVGEREWLRANRPNDPLASTPFRQGDLVTTMISCSNGETITLVHDCTLPRPYSRGGRVQGTRGIWMEDNRSIYLEGRSPAAEHSWAHAWESDRKYMDEYLHPLWKAYESFGLRGGHGGMDYLALRGFIEAIQQGTPFPIDVYDTAAWMAVTALSEQSIATASLLPFPDFTSGQWMTGTPSAQGIYRL